MSTTEGPLNRIHVNNLAWSIKEEDLKKHFSKFGEIEKVKIPTRPKGGSKGFGFITFKTKEAAQNAVEKMNNVSIEQRRIGVVFSTSVEKKKEKPVVGDEEETNKLVVRQLAWAVKNKQLTESFESFGKATCRVVKARNGMSKGFGFVSYETVAEAKAAKDAMNGKEIEGRAITVHFSKSTGPRKRNARPKKEEQTEEKDEASPAKQGSKKRRRKGKGKGKKREGEKEGGAPDPAPEPKPKKRRPRNKLYVKISTESTDEDIRGVFSTYGALKKVDIPLNKEGTPKGHAYVQFQNEEDATSALEGSKTTELKGVCFESDWARSRPRRRRNN